MLDAPGFITHRVIRLYEDGGLKPNDLDRLWKFYGYWGGPLLLDELVYDDMPSLPKPATKSDVKRFLAADIRSLIKRRAAFALRTLPLDNPKVAMKLVKVYAQIQEIEGRERRANQQANVAPNFQQNIEAFLDGIAFLSNPRPVEGTTLQVAPKLGPKSTTTEPGIGTLHPSPRQAPNIL